MILNYGDELLRSVDRPPFSNGFEGESWMANWCERCRNDEDEGCPLVLVALLGRTPQPWKAQDHTQGWSLGNAYHCTEFEEAA